MDYFYLDKCCAGEFLEVILVFGEQIISTQIILCQNA